MDKVIEKLIIENNGVFKTADAVIAGKSKDSIYKYIKNSDLKKVAHGIYVANDAVVDEFYLLQAQFPKVIFSHESALYLHDLAEKEPSPLGVTVSANYNSSGLKEKHIKIFYTKNEWYKLGIIEMESFGGHIIRVYYLERTICDIVRRYNDMDVAVFNYAVTEYVKRKDKDYIKLVRYAKILGIERKIREKMGVLF